MDIPIDQTKVSVVCSNAPLQRAHDPEKGLTVDTPAVLGHLQETKCYHIATIVLLSDLAMRHDGGH